MAKCRECGKRGWVSYDGVTEICPDCIKSMPNTTELTALRAENEQLRAENTEKEQRIGALEKALRVANAITEGKC